MLKIIGLKNFKSFESLDELKIKPLTLLCGVNSGGKSSIIKSLLILKQSYENSLVTNELTLNGNYTLNGTMKDILYKGQGKKFSLRNVFRLEYHGKKYQGRAKQDLTSAKEIGKMLDLSPNDVQFFELEIVCTISRKHEEGIVESNYISNYIINIRPYDKKSKLIENKAFSVHLKIYKKSIYDDAIFPMEGLCENYNNYVMEQIEYKQMNQNEKNALFEKIGNVVAVYNFYNKNQRLCRLNSTPNKKRIVYTKNEGSVYHLSLDFESGGFEVFDKNYVHMGQYNFSCTIAKKAQPMTHRLIH